MTSDHERLADLLVDLSTCVRMVEQARDLAAGDAILVRPLGLPDITIDLCRRMVDQVIDQWLNVLHPIASELGFEDVRDLGRQLMRATEPLLWLLDGDRHPGRPRMVH